MPAPTLHSIITGGTGALGSAVVAALLDRGHTCHIPVLHDHELNNFPFPHHANVRITRAIDLTDEPSVERFYASVAAPLWASIHIAGGFTYGPIESVSKHAFVAQMQQNALTCFLCCREAVKSMSRTSPERSEGSSTSPERSEGSSTIPQRSNGSSTIPQRSDGPAGRIINIAARPALEPRTGVNMIPYTASKAAVAAITQALAEEVISRGHHNILINAVVPSIIDTPANRAAMPAADFATWPKVAHIAATIAFLASPDNTTTRGGLIPVYGAS